MSIARLGAEVQRTEPYPAAPNAKGNPIPGLNALRASAVLLVIAFHAAQVYHFSILVSGPLGVMIFFVLSGYLISGILLSEYRKTGDISLRRFYIRRAFRIFPAFYVCCILVALTFKLHHLQINKIEAFGSLLYVTNYLKGLSADPANVYMGIGWSLAIEEQFYIVWPLFLLTLLRRKAKLGRAIVIMIGFVWIIKSVAFLSGAASENYIYNAFEMRADSLLVGALFVTTKGTSSKIRAFVTSSPWMTLPTGAFVAWAALGEQHWSVIARSRPAFLLLSFLEPVVIGVLLIQLVRWGGLMARWLEHPAIAFIASISYTLYLYHITAIAEGFRIHGFAAHPKLGAIVLLPILTLASYYLVERPALAVRDRMFP